jgi:hypothetical protein
MVKTWKETDHYFEFSLGSIMFHEESCTVRCSTLAATSDEDKIEELICVLSDVVDLIRQQKSIGGEE